MYDITVSVAENEKVTQNVQTLGSETRTGTSTLSVTVPAGYTTYKKYLEFKRNYKIPTKILIEKGVAAIFTYVIPYAIMQIAGQLGLQIVCESPGVAVHTSIYLGATSQTITTEITNPTVLKTIYIKGNLAGIIGSVVITGTNSVDGVISETLELAGIDEVVSLNLFKTVTQIVFPIQTNIGTDIVEIGTSEGIFVSEIFSMGIKTSIKANSTLLLNYHDTFAQMLADIGTISTLTTTIKTSLVNAINWIYAQLGITNTILSTETTNRVDADGVLQDNINAHTGRTDNPHSVTKLQIGLENVDNTSDTDKPISLAAQTTLDTKVDKTTGYALSKNDYSDVEKAKVTDAQKIKGNLTPADENIFMLSELTPLNGNYFIDGDYYLNTVYYGGEGVPGILYLSDTTFGGEAYKILVFTALWDTANGGTYYATIPIPVTPDRAIAYTDWRPSIVNKSSIAVGFTENGGIDNALGTKIDKTSIDTDSTMVANSDELVPSQSATKLALNGLPEVDTLTIFTGATTSGVIQISLDNIVYDLWAEAGDTPAQTATRIRNQGINPWIITLGFGDSGDVIFTDATNIAREAPSFNGGLTGVTGEIARTQIGSRGKEPTIVPSEVGQYWGYNKAWKDFATDVRDAILTGLSVATNAAIATSDTVLSALGKLQAQINSLLTIKVDKVVGSSLVADSNITKLEGIGSIISDTTYNNNWVDGITNVGGTFTDATIAALATGAPIENRYLTKGVMNFDSDNIGGTYYNKGVSSGNTFSLYSTVARLDAVAISAFADYSGTVAGMVKATSTGHGLPAASCTTPQITISGTTDYDGTYDVKWIDANNFYFAHAFTTTKTGAFTSIITPTDDTATYSMRSAKLSTLSINYTAGDTIFFEYSIAKLTVINTGVATKYMVNGDANVRIWGNGGGASIDGNYSNNNFIEFISNGTFKKYSKVVTKIKLTQDTPTFTSHLTKYYIERFASAQTSDDKLKGVVSFSETGNPLVIENLASVPSTIGISPIGTANAGIRNGARIVIMRGV